MADMMRDSNKTDITILHFNDVYHISDHELVAKFATVLRNPTSILGYDIPEDTLRIFSGDALSPSLEAAVLRGDHMTPVLNELDIDIACYGNHDFDFGESQLIDLSKHMKFPRTLANAIGQDTAGRQRLLAESQEYVIREVGGIKVGFFGLAGTDWPSNCQHLPSCVIEDPSITAKRVARHLRKTENCDLVIAITHMRLLEDLEVKNATESGDEKVDLLLGGHDHNVVRRKEDDNNANPEVLETGVPGDISNSTNSGGNYRIIKSGTDWRGLSTLRLQITKDADGSSHISDMTVTQISDLPKLPSYNDITPSPAMLQILDGVHDRIETVVTQPLLRTDVPLNGISSIIRSQETNLGNMLADAVRAFYNADIALVNSGAVRCDRIVECITNSPLCIRDVIDISPFDNAFVVKRIGGNVLAEALENSVSDAHTDGRFLQLSGLSIVASWHEPEGQRVKSIDYTSDGDRSSLDNDKMYTVAMVDFIGSGFDGYTCFKDSETLVDTEGAMTDTNMLLEIFKKDASSTTEQDEHTAGIQRARKAIIRSYDKTDGLPLVAPGLDSRITFI